MAIWNDKIKTVYEAIAGSAVYNGARSTTPTNLDLIVLNQARDWLVMYKPWRDLRRKYTDSLDSDRKLTLPDDFGMCDFVYSDPGETGKPQYFFTLNSNDISRRYEEEVTQDETTGKHTRKFVWPIQTPISGDPIVVYSIRLDDYTMENVANDTLISFFPLTLMLVVAKQMYQDYYGVPAHQDPKWILQRVQTELRMFEAYAYNNNVPLDMSIKDPNGNPVFIPGMSLSGRSRGHKRPSPYYPSTLITGGTG